MKPDRSAARISGWLAGSSAARPRRWSAEARDTRTVSSLVSPTSGSYRGTRASPESITTRTPSMVSEVSAIEVASTTFRRPAGGGAIARS
jgi:hypothetical protein